MRVTTETILYQLCNYWAMKITKQRFPQKCGEYNLLSCQNSSSHASFEFPWKLRVIRDGIKQKNIVPISVNIVTTIILALKQFNSIYQKSAKSPIQNQIRQKLYSVCRSKFFSNLVSPHRTLCTALHRPQSLNLM